VFELSERDKIIAEFDEKLFSILVERVVVSGGNLEFEFLG
jgi:hypothetical protein